MSTEDLAGVPQDSLERAMRIQTDASALGFDWPDVHGVVEKLHEEIAEVCEALDRGQRDHACHEVGDLLFSVVNLARFIGATPGAELDRTTDRFQRRFARVKEAVARSGRPMAQWSLDDLDAIWDAAKAEGL